MLFYCYFHKKLIIFEKHVPWKRAISKYDEPLIALMPRGDGKYQIHAVPKGDPREMGYRQYLPSDWAGLRDEELQKVTGVADAIFCHNDRFIAVAGSYEGALKLAHIALNM